MVGLRQCNKDSVKGTLARMYCPSTCGCGNPFSALLYDQEYMGCPAGCLAKYAEQIDSRPCKDAEPNSAELKAYGKELNAYATYASGVEVEEPTCDAQSTFVQYWTPTVLCNTGYVGDIKTMRAFCPIMCGCRSSDPGCSSSCPKQSSLTP